MGPRIVVVIGVIMNLKIIGERKNIFSLSIQNIFSCQMYLEGLLLQELPQTPERKPDRTDKFQKTSS